MKLITYPQLLLPNKNQFQNQPKKDKQLTISGGEIDHFFPSYCYQQQLFSKLSEPAPRLPAPPNLHSKIQITYHWPLVGVEGVKSTNAQKLLPNKATTKIANKATTPTTVSTKTKHLKWIKTNQNKPKMNSRLAKEPMKTEKTSNPNEPSTNNNYQWTCKNERPIDYIWLKPIKYLQIAKVKRQEEG